MAYHLDAKALLGRAVRVLWPDDAAWYLGTVALYDESTGEHEVRFEVWGSTRCGACHPPPMRAPAHTYRSPSCMFASLGQVQYVGGDCERLHLAVEDIRLLVHAGEAPHRTPPPALRALAALLDQQGHALEKVWGGGVRLCNHTPQDAQEAALHHAQHEHEHILM
eukprot:353973-Chlamydomonas_euryale.AAC.3